MYLLLLYWVEAPFTMIRSLGLTALLGVVFSLAVSFGNIVALAESGPNDSDKIWTLETVLEKAERDNPSLQAAIAQEPIARGGITQAKTFPNPMLNLFVGPVEQTYHPVELSTTLQMGGKRKIQIQIAKSQLESTNATIRAVAWKVREDTALAFYDYAIAQKYLEVLQDDLKAGERLLAITQQRNASGHLTDLDFLRVKALLEDVKILFPALESHLVQTRRQINILIRRPPDAPLDIQSPLPLREGVPPHLPPDFETLVAQSRESRPEYQQYEADIAAQKDKIRLSKAGRWPNVQLGAGMSMVAQTRKNFWGENFRYGPEFFAQIPVTLVDHQQGAYAIAQASAQQIQIQKQAFDNEVQQAINQAFANLESTTRQLRMVLIDVLPNQQAIILQGLQSYAEGKIDTDQAISVQQTAMAARLSAMDVLSRYFQSRVELERAVGKPIDFDSPSTNKLP